MPDDGTADALRVAVARLLRRAGPAVGTWPEDENLDPSRARLEDFRVPVGSLADTKAGRATPRRPTSRTPSPPTRARTESSQPSTGSRTSSCPARVADSSCAAIADEEAARFYVQRPPTLRLSLARPRHVRPHRDGEYGHQDGEVNFWLPLTDLRRRAHPRGRIQTRRG